MAGQDHVTWVTGAGSGMGRAAALAAARSGRAVALSGRRTDRLEEVRETIEAEGGRAMAVPGDTTDPAWAPEAASTVLAAWGRIDELVVAAGLNEPARRWDDQSMTGFEAVVATNLTGVARVIDAALPAL